MRPAVLRAIRIGALVGFAAGLGLLNHRLRRSPEQIELTHYVEVEAPALQRLEDDPRRDLERLGQPPPLQPEEARRLLVDRIIPELLRLRRQAGGLRLQTSEGRALHASYLRAVDRWIEAARTSVRTIDDPEISGPAGLVLVRERFGAADRAYAAWQEQVRVACVRNRLAPPEARRRPSR